MSPAVDFHTGIAEPLDFACRLLRKAVRRGVRVLVTTPRAAELDRLLWTFEVGDFVPHARCPEAPVSLLARTPLWLAGSVDAALAVANLGPAMPRVLVNLCAEPPPDASSWRGYKAQGLDITHHAPAGTGSSSVPSSVSSSGSSSA
jgi:DNA polymerase-3 subunit chi